MIRAILTTYAVSNPLYPPDVNWYCIYLDEHAAGKSLQGEYQICYETGSCKVSNRDDTCHGAHYCYIMIDQSYCKENQKLFNFAVKTGHKIDQSREDKGSKNILSQHPCESARKDKWDRVDAVLCKLTIKRRDVDSPRNKTAGFANS